MAPPPGLAGGWCTFGFTWRRQAAWRVWDSFEGRGVDFFLFCICWASSNSQVFWGFCLGAKPYPKCFVLDFLRFCPGLFDINYRWEQIETTFLGRTLFASYRLVRFWYLDGHPPYMSRVEEVAQDIQNSQVLRKVDVCAGYSDRQSMFHHFGQKEVDDLLNYHSCVQLCVFYAFLRELLRSPNREAAFSSKAFSRRVRKQIPVCEWDPQGRMIDPGKFIVALQISEGLAPKWLWQAPRSGMGRHKARCMKSGGVISSPCR